MLTTITIGVATLNASARASAGFVGIDSLTISVDQDWELEFTVLGCGPNPPYLAGQSVQLVTSNDDGSGPIVRFTGNISSTQDGQADSGWRYAYHCYGMRRRTADITLQSSSGTCAAQYNLSPDDPDYDHTRAGMTVGAIVLDVLTTYSNAIQLFDVGIAGYSFSGTTATLSGQILVDLAMLTVVPNIAVRLEGESILSVLDQFVRDWHAQYGLWVNADGSMRIASPFAFPPVTLKVAGTGQLSPDPVEWPEHGPDLDNCYARYQILGQDLDGALLSTQLGTLTPVNSSTDRGNWNSSYATQPKGSTDNGTCTVTSSTSCTVTSENPGASWASGFWPGVSGVIYLVNTSTGGLPQFVRRVVTISAAMTAGGSADIEWDSSQPLDYSTYSHYSLVGSDNPLAFVDRLFWITDPATGNTGLNTFIGANLSNRDPNGIPWANNGEYQNVFYPTAKIVWGLNADNANPALRFPMDEIPVGVKVLKQTGQILLDYPACFLAALQAGSFDGLQLGYPTTAFQGLWYNIQVAVPYSRGPLVAQYPPSGGGVAGSGFQGTAYTSYGLQRTKTVLLDSYTSREQTAAMVALAGERLVTMCDAVIEGGILHHGIPSGFDPFVPGYSLRVVMPQTSGIDGLNLPVRTVVIRWPNEGPDIHTVAFRFSNKKAPFSADSRYLHPAYTRDGSEAGFLFEIPVDLDPLGFSTSKSGMAGRAARRQDRREGANATDAAKAARMHLADLAAAKLDSPPEARQLSDLAPLDEGGTLDAADKLRTGAGG